MAYCHSRVISAIFQTAPLPERGLAKARRYAPASPTWEYTRRLLALCLIACQSAREISVRHVEPPTYPPLARAAAIQGDIPVSVEIARDGKVIAVKANAGNPLLRRAAEDSLRHWIFRPLTPRVKAPFKHTVVMEFKLEGEATFNYRTHLEYDLPARVRVITQPPTVNPSGQ